MTVTIMRLIRIFSAAAFLAATVTAWSDVIIKADGTSFPCFNIEKSEKYIFYTESADDPEAIKRIPIEEVYGIKRGSNPIEVIEYQGAATSASVAEKEAEVPAHEGVPVMLEPKVSVDNERLINFCNTPTLEFVGKKPNGKNTRAAIIIWGIEPSSVLSDDNIEVHFERLSLGVPVSRGAGLAAASTTAIGGTTVNNYRVSVLNKTNKPIYIDLGNSFKISGTGHSVPYFTNSVYTSSSSSTQGASVNLGAVAGALGIGGAVGTMASGVNVGGANTGGTVVTQMEQQILTVPPHAVVSLPGEKVASGNGFTEVFEYFGVSDVAGLSAKALNLTQWAPLDFTPDDTVKRMKRLITYSTRPDFAEYTTVPINLYVSRIMGCGGNRLLGSFPTPKEIMGDAVIYTAETLQK